MRHRKGPTKKLAPAIGPEISCPHAYTEDDVLQLEIDCSACAGASDLSNQKCLRAVLNIMSTGAPAHVIILKRYIHKRYRGSLVTSAHLASVELATINRALLSADQPSDKRCRTCPASRERVLRVMKLELLEDPLAFVGDHPRLMNELRGRCHSDCGESDRCVDRGLAVSTLDPEVQGQP